VPGAFATVVSGFLLLMARTKAISQVCGYLLLENGIFLFGLLLFRATPLIVEAGILLDLTVAVFVIGIIVDRIQREFDTMDTRQLTSLRE
jgi:hydrogenase-4 component E